MFLSNKTETLTSNIFYGSIFLNLSFVPAKIRKSYFQIMANTDNVDFYNILAPHHPTTSRRTEQNIRSMRKDLG